MQKLEEKDTWYRPVRFLNRKKPKGWLAPSIEHKLDSHIKLIENIQKINNPEISGVGDSPENLLTLWMIVNALRTSGNVVNHTYGYITKNNRIAIGIEKSHINDAFIIAGGAIQERKPCKEYGGEVHKRIP